MSMVFKITKQPDEKTIYAIDFSDAISGDGTLTSVTTVAYDEADGTSCWDIMDGGVSISSSGTSISLGILGGISGQRYHIEVIGTLNSLLPDGTNYETIEADVYVSVRDY